MFKKNDRRKISNVIVDPGALLRLSIPFFAMLLVCTGTIILIHHRVLKILAHAQTTPGENDAAIGALTAALNVITMTGTWGMGIFGIVCVGMWIIYSHRIFGPTVPIQRHLDNLNEGNYESRIKLRPGDEFGPIADKLNTLAEKLQARK